MWYFVTSAVATSQQIPVRQRAFGLRLVAAAVVLGFLYLASSFVMTLVVSLLLFFLCDPVVSWLGRRGLPRAVGSLLMVMALLAIAYGAFYVFYAQAQAFVNDFPNYSEKLRRHALRFRQKAEQIQEQTDTVMAVEKSARRPVRPAAPQTDWTTYLGAGLRSATEIVFLVSFIPFLIYFLLAWKDHLRRNSVILFAAGNRMAAEKTLDGITMMIRGFIFGNVIIGAILSTASALLFVMMGLPYAALMAPISGFLSVVPYLGALLAMIPPILAGATKYDTLAPLVGIASGVAGFHIIALNVLYPKLIGARLHLNPVVVTVSLMFWGWLWGAMGLLLAIPITAAIKAIFDNVPEWRRYGRLMAD